MAASRLDLLNKYLLKLIRQIRLLYYRREIRAAARNNPALYAPVDAALEQAHKAYWSALGRVDCSWLRLYVKLSGIADKRYIPGDIYNAIVERRLNDGNYNALVSDKNYLERLFGSEHFPVAILRRMSGTFLDRNYAISHTPMSLLPNRNVLIKPSVDSKGGADVALLRYKNGEHRTAGGQVVTPSLLAQTWGDSFIVQELLEQHDFCAAFNPGSVNTFRVYVYRSVSDDSVHVLKVVFRTGAGDSVVDNMARSGGVSTVVDSRGCLDHYAVSKAGELFTHHPVSGEAYDGRAVPNYERITGLPCEIAARVPSHRLLGFDVALTRDGTPKIVEINPMGMSLNMMQYGGGPLFGDFTDEVIEYCASNPEKDNMRVLRT